MLSSVFDVTVNGRTITVTASPGAGGKTFVRVNGKLVTRPIGAEETSRELTLEGARFRLLREGEGWRFEPLDTGQTLLSVRPKVPPLSFLIGALIAISGMWLFAALVLRIVHDRTMGQVLAADGSRIRPMVGGIESIVVDLTTGMQIEAVLFALIAVAVLVRARLGAEMCCWMALLTAATMLAMADRGLHAHLYRNFAAMHVKTALSSAHLLGSAIMIATAIAVAVVLQLLHSNDRRSTAQLSSSGRSSAAPGAGFRRIAEHCFAELIDRFPAPGELEAEAVAVDGLCFAVVLDVEQFPPGDGDPVLASLFAEIVEERFPSGGGDDDGVARGARPPELHHPPQQLVALAAAQADDALLPELLVPRDQLGRGVAGEGAVAFRRLAAAEDPDAVEEQEKRGEGQRQDRRRRAADSGDEFGKGHGLLVPGIVAD
jgi:hypothetical protein